jgi:hypothetical protein
MLKRLIVGLVLGAIIGAVVAAVLVQGLGMAVFTSGVYAYLAAAVTGILAGLVAGKPIWSADGRIEAGLKAFFGMLLGLGAMVVLRYWVHLGIDLTALKAGAGEIGALPAASLPLIAAVLSGFFELDNTPSADKDEAEAKSSSGKKPEAKRKVRVADDGEAAADEDVAEEPAAKKKQR